jgi:hypothetical protein
LRWAWRVVDDGIHAHKGEAKACLAEATVYREGLGGNIANSATNGHTHHSLSVLQRDFARDFAGQVGIASVSFGDCSESLPAMEASRRSVLNLKEVSWHLEGSVSSLKSK